MGKNDESNAINLQRKLDKNKREAKGFALEIGSTYLSCGDYRHELTQTQLENHGFCLAGKSKVDG